MRASTKLVMAMMSTVMVVSAKVSAPETKAYARSAITISAAVVRLSVVSLRSVVRLRSVIGPPGSVIAIASVVAVVTMAMVTMAAMSTEVGGLACPDGCGVGLNRVIGICCGATNQRGYADGNGDGNFFHFTHSRERLWSGNRSGPYTFLSTKLNRAKLLNIRSY